MPTSHIPTGDEGDSSSANPSTDSQKSGHNGGRDASPANEHADTPQPWYAEGLQFECTQCGDCCTGAPGAVWVTESELEEIASTLGQTVGEVRLLHTKLISGRWSLRDYANGDCVYLDPSTRKCRVYSARPIQCRTWPFWKQNIETRDSWTRTCERCPGAGTGALHSLEVITLEAGKCDVIVRNALNLNVLRQS